jgi:class 3 adenylate cyclase
MEPRIQYAKTSDGVRIAYSAVGDGPSLIVTPYQWASHVRLEWEHPPVRGPLERLAAACRVIRYDRRGAGLSDRDLKITPDTEQADLSAVVRAAGESSVRLLGRGFGAPATIRFAALNPADTAALIVYDPVTSVDVLRTDPRLLARTVVIEALIDRDVDALVDVLVPMGGGAGWWADYFREATDRAHYKQLLEFRDDVSSLLPDVHCPTLIVSEKDSAWIKAADEIARGIERSELATAALDDPEAEMADISARVFSFLGIDAPPLHNSQDTSHGTTAIILFADIVDSTALTESLGDAAFREKARDLDAALRGIIREHLGTPIDGKLLGDGVLATFASARQAIEAALACGKAGDEGGLPLHLGLHAGDVIREQNNVFGGAVNIASRISGLSAPGEVLVSQTVRDLARTSAGVAFGDRGEQALKGVGELVRVWVVKEQGAGSRDQE